MLFRGLKINYPPTKLAPYGLGFELMSQLSRELEVLGYISIACSAFLKR